MNGVAGIVGDLGQRFRLVDLLPTSVLSVTIVALVSAGAPSEPPSLERVVDAAEQATLVEGALLGLAILIVSVLLVPLAVPLVRLLEGYWGTSRLIRPLAEVRTRRHASKRAVLAARTRADGAEVSEEQRQAALEAAWDLTRRYPPQALAMPTALGNVLRSAEFRAGRPYGLDSAIAWPRLYPLLDAEIRALVDDRRQQLDVTARFAVVFATLAVVTVVLLVSAGWWLLLPFVVCFLAWVSYRAAVTAAIAYGEALDAAFDLGHFALATKLGLQRPKDAADERSRNQDLTVFLSRLRLPGSLGYADDSSPTSPPSHTPAPPAVPSGPATREQATELEDPTIHART